MAHGTRTLVPRPRTECRRRSLGRRPPADRDLETRRSGAAISTRATRAGAGIAMVLRAESGADCRDDRELPHRYAVAVEAKLPLEPIPQRAQRWILFATHGNCLARAAEGGAV